MARKKYSEDLAKSGKVRCLSDRKFNVVSVDVILGKARKCSYLKEDRRAHSLVVLFDLYDEQGKLIHSHMRYLLWTPLGFNATEMVTEVVRRNLESVDYILDWKTYQGIRSELATYNYKML